MGNDKNNEELRVKNEELRIRTYPTVLKTSKNSAGDNVLILRKLQMGNKK